MGRRPLLYHGNPLAHFFSDGSSSTCIVDSQIPHPLMLLRVLPLLCTALRAVSDNSRACFFCDGVTSTSRLFSLLPPICWCFTFFLCSAFCLCSACFPCYAIFLLCLPCSAVTATSNACIANFIAHPKSVLLLPHLLCVFLPLLLIFPLLSAETTSFMVITRRGNKQLV